MLAPAPPKMQRHGTRSRYNTGCRCDPCRKANNAYMLKWQHEPRDSSALIDPSGLRQYIECLTSFGLERGQIAEAAGVYRGMLQLKRAGIQRGSARKIESLHWGLHYRHYPFRQHCQCTHDLVVLESFSEVAS